MFNAKTVIIGIIASFCVLMLGLTLILLGGGANGAKMADRDEISAEPIASSENKADHVISGAAVGSGERRVSNVEALRKGSDQAIGYEGTEAEDALEGIDVKALISESLQVYNEYDRVTREMEGATSDLNERRKPIRDRIAWLKEPVFDEERAYDVNRNIRFFSNLAARLERQIEIAKITDPNERAKLSDKYEADRVRLLAEEGEASKPFGERLDELEAGVKDEQGPFEEGMKAYCLLPKRKYRDLAGTTVSAVFHTGKATYKWLDNEGKQLAWALVQLKDMPVIDEGGKMLDGKFYVSQHYRIDMHVWAGHLEVTFKVIKPEWQGEDKIAELIKDLIDLDGLARIDPTRGKGSLNTLAKDSLACSKKYRRIVRERSEVTGPLADQRVNAKYFKRRLSGPPADSEQLEEDKSSLEDFKLDFEREQARLEIGRITDLSKRAAMLAKLEAEHKTLLAEKDRISKPYYDKQRELRSGLEDKEAVLNEAMKKYLLMGGKAYPGAKSVSTRTIFYKGEISCNWKDGGGKTLCYAGLRVRNRPVIRKDAPMLDGGYYISEIVNNCIRVWAGNFEVGFNVDVDKREWHGEEKIGDILKHFVDLEGLAKID